MTTMPKEKNTTRKPLAEISKETPKNIPGQGTGDSEQYQRGGSGSEGGFAHEESHGPDPEQPTGGSGAGGRETKR